MLPAMSGRSSSRLEYPHHAACSHSGPACEWRRPTKAAPMVGATGGSFRWTPSRKLKIAQRLHQIEANWRCRPTSVLVKAHLANTEVEGEPLSVAIDPQDDQASPRPHQRVPSRVTFADRLGQRKKWPSKLRISRKVLGIHLIGGLLQAVSLIFRNVVCSGIEL